MSINKMNGLPQVAYTSTRSAEFADALGKMANPLGYQKCYSESGGDISLVDRSAEPTVAKKIGTMDVSANTFNAVIANSTAAFRARVTLVCGLYGVTYAEA